MDDHFVIGDRSINPGTKKIVRLKVTQDLDGSAVSVWVHVIKGEKPGPTLGLFSVQHGDEWITFDLFRRLVELVDQASLTGTLLIVPVCNPPALCANQRCIQPKSDGPDLNRVWPGVHTWLSELIAQTIDREVIRKCDALLDFHHGPWGTAFGEVFYGADFEDQTLVQKCHDLGVAFGYPRLAKSRLMNVFPGPKSIMGYVGSQLGMPSLGVEIGGAGFSPELERNWLNEAEQGVKNVMRHMGMLDEPLVKPDQILTYVRTVRVSPSVGGMMVPEENPDKLQREVKQGELLGKIISPYTFEELERLEAPCDGWLKWVSRPYPVRPGEWAFGIADADGAEWIKP